MKYNSSGWSNTHNSCLSDGSLASEVKKRRLTKREMRRSAPFIQEFPAKEQNKGLYNCEQ